MTQATERKPVFRLPDRETWIANWILGTLKFWKRCHDKRFRDKDYKAPWTVSNSDLEFLESEAARLWDTWDRTKEMAERNHEIKIRQPSAISSKQQ